MRSGQLIERVVNPIIAAHPGRTKFPFHGNAFNRTEIAYYDKPEVPDQPAVILVSDTWGLFEWRRRALGGFHASERASTYDSCSTKSCNRCVRVRMDTRDPQPSRKPGVASAR